MKESKGVIDSVAMKDPRRISALSTFNIRATDRFLSVSKAPAMKACDPYILPDPTPWRAIAAPLGRGEDSLGRLDERLSRSPVREGWIARSHFSDACAALWLEGELVHLEDLVLHDAGMDVRAPTHALIRAHAILRARRRIAAAAPDWPLSTAGLAALRGEAAPVATLGQGRGSARASAGADVGDGDEEWDRDPLDDQTDDHPVDPDGEFADVDVLIARTSHVIDGEASRPRDALVYDLDWRENERLTCWSALRDQTKDLSPLHAGALLWEAWETIQPLQHRPWLGALLVGAHLRAANKTKAHLLCLSSGLRLVARERRRAPDRAGRLVACLQSVEAAAEAGMKDHDRWLLARGQLERKLAGRRKNSHMRALIDLVLTHPIASAGLIARELGVTPRAAQNLVAELGPREATGRGRYRAWGIF
jgi:hypothetical protein